MGGDDYYVGYLKSYIIAAVAMGTALGCFALGTPRSWGFGWTDGCGNGKTDGVKQKKCRKSNAHLDFWQYFQFLLAKYRRITEWSHGKRFDGIR